MNKGWRKARMSLAVVLLLSSVFLGTTVRGEGCYTVVVGAGASTDGFVIMAHNEDDGAPQVVNHHKMPRRMNPPGDTVTLRNGGQLEQVGETWSYIWSEIPGMTFSDSYVNEWGVCIASDNCPSREDQPELTEGGINYMLRRLVAQRARSARDGVMIAGELIERFGYDASGRTYTICDPYEGWVLCAVNGKHWLAKRVPDNEVALIANTYTISEVDLEDPSNYLASEDIVEYAIERGWHNPDTDTVFDFAACYANPQVAADSGNICRQWSGLSHVAAEPVVLSQQLPFSVRPRRRMGPSAVMGLLRNHYEGTDLYRPAPNTGSPHENNPHPICNRTTQTSFVAQLRDDIMSDIGIVYWVSLSTPCTSPFIPFHFGLDRFPSFYQGPSVVPSDSLFEALTTNAFEPTHESAFWTFSNFSYKIDAAYGDKAGAVQNGIEHLEGRALSLQKHIEVAASRVYATDKAASLDLLQNYSLGLYLSAVEWMSQIHTD